MGQRSCFEQVYYHTDLEADTVEERRAIGLPDSSLLTQLKGDQLRTIVKEVLGIHTVSAYRSCVQFGQPQYSRLFPLQVIEHPLGVELTDPAFSALPQKH